MVVRELTHVGLLMRFHVLWNILHQNKILHFLLQKYSLCSLYKRPACYAPPWACLRSTNKTKHICLSNKVFLILYSKRAISPRVHILFRKPQKLQQKLQFWFTRAIIFWEIADFSRIVMNCAPEKNIIFVYFVILSYIYDDKLVV